MELDPVTMNVEVLEISGDRALYVFTFVIEPESP